MLPDPVRQPVVVDVDLAVLDDPVQNGESPQRRASRARRLPSRLAFPDLQHAHATLGTGGLKRRAHSANPQTPAKHQRLGSHGGAGGAAENTVSPAAGPVQAECRMAVEGSLFAHLAEMLVLNPSCSITEIETGPARFASVGRGDPSGNVAVWVRSGQDSESTCVLISTVQRQLISGSRSLSTMTRSETARTASIDRNILHMLRNSDAQYASLEHAAEVEINPMSGDHMLAYDADAGRLYLSEGNQRANFERVGWSQVAVEGLYSVQSQSEGTEDMALSILGADRPLMEPGFGLPVCTDEDDRLMVKALLTIIRQHHLSHPLQVRVCMGSIRAIVELGASGPVIS